MSEWKPISYDEFRQLFENQYRELGPRAREIFDRYRVDIWKATIRRSDMAGDEAVYVVAQSGDGVLYFDDVEYGFNIATIDRDGRILTPGGSQSTLGEAVDGWFTASADEPRK
ncbi:hypothetical protein [Sorangium sp. So ce1097]|uniref:hypothetical protein n=1 Tax=Sorangium sp. So ce1097 TaxID=3133330 RepID=UPI003F606807